MKITSIFCRFLVLYFILSISTNTFSQVLTPGFSAGVHAGATKAFTDVTDADINASYGASLQYNVTPFTFGNIEYSMGNLSKKELDKHGKGFLNEYKRFTATANISLGQLLNPDYNVAHFFLYNLYAGTGIGLIMSNISEPTAFTRDGFGGTTYKGSDLAVPVNLGLNFKFASYIYPDSPLNFNINLQHNFGFTELLDGYDPNNADNKIKDSFTTLNFSMKYNFGSSR